MIVNFSLRPPWKTGGRVTQEQLPRWPYVTRVQGFVQECTYFARGHESEAMCEVTDYEQGSDLLYSAHPWAPPLRSRRRFAPTFKFSPGEFVTFHVQVGFITKT